MTAVSAPLPACAPCPARPSPAARATRAAAVACVLALALLALAWELWLAPLRPGGSWVALNGLWRYRLYPYRWVSLFLWLYVTEGVVRATTEGAPARWLALGEVLLCLGLFAACVLHIRARLKAGRLAAQATQTARQEAAGA